MDKFKRMTFPFAAQVFLIAMYVILTVLFARTKNTWPLSAYYAGCFIKDAAVFALGWFLTHKK